MPFGQAMGSSLTRRINKSSPAHSVYVLIFVKIAAAVFAFPKEFRVCTKYSVDTVSNSHAHSINISLFQISTIRAVHMKQHTEIKITVQTVDINQFPVNPLEAFAGGFADVVSAPRARSRHPLILGHDHDDVIKAIIGRERSMMISGLNRLRTKPFISPTP